MAIYRVFSDADGESHIEDLKLEEHPELGTMINVSEVRVQEFDGSRNMDFHPCPSAGWLSTCPARWKLGPATARNEC